jgi:hypothetical protein
MDPLALFEDDVHFGGYFAHFICLLMGCLTLGDATSFLRRFFMVSCPILRRHPS